MAVCLVAIAALSLALLPTAASASYSPAGTVTEFSAGVTPGSGPMNITAGPDGNVWFTENAGQIGRITPSGTVTEFSTGVSANSLPDGITTGPEGNIWFTEFEGGRIGRITPSGTVTEFSTGITPGSAPVGITTGPEGNLWFTESPGTDRADHPVRHGHRVLYRDHPQQRAIPDHDGPGRQPLVHGAHWQQDRADHPVRHGHRVLGRITAGSEPHGITTGPEGNLWFTESGGNRIGRITPSGTVTEFSTGISAGGEPRAITTGPDGNLWFTEQNGNRIGRITPSGTVTEFSTGISASSFPLGIAAAPTATSGSRSRMAAGSGGSAPGYRGSAPARAASPERPDRPEQRERPEAAEPQERPERRDRPEQPAAPEPQEQPARPEQPASRERQDRTCSFPAGISTFQGSMDKNINGRSFPITAKRRSRRRVLKRKEQSPLGTGCSRVNHRWSRRAWKRPTSKKAPTPALR